MPVHAICTVCTVFLGTVFGAAPVISAAMPDNLPFAPLKTLPRHFFNKRTAVFMERIGDRGNVKVAKLRTKQHRRRTVA